MPGLYIQSRTLLLSTGPSVKISNPEQMHPCSIYKLQSVTQINIGTGICAEECLKHWANTSGLLCEQCLQKRRFGEGNLYCNTQNTQRRSEQFINITRGPVYKRYFRKTLKVIDKTGKINIWLHNIELQQNLWSGLYGLHGNGHLWPHANWSL
jgi:hypothetical protein